MAIRNEGSLALQPGQSTSWFIHGYGYNEWVSFSIVVNNQIGSATLTQGEAWIHVDGSRAYKIYFKANPSNYAAVGVQVLSNVQSL
jgi:hypothetical protein